MKKKILGILLTAALMVSLCGTVFATEVSEQVEETTESEIMDESDSAMIVDSFFSDSTTTFVKGAKTVGDIVSGIGDHAYTVNTATADTIADDIITDSNFITAITFDASDVDFDTVGEYTVIYRIFIDVDTLNDYIEDNDIDDVDISDITSDSIGVCISCTVSIVDEDENIEADETADTETQDTDDFTVAEINELTWTYEQINSIPDVITGIGSINPEDEDIDPEFDVDISIVDAVLYDMSGVNPEEPDTEDVAYYTYFDREALLNYMEETNIDIDAYEGLEDATTDYIMVYYGPITELALTDVIDGLTDHYVLVDSENIDYEYGVAYNDDVVKSITTNSEDVDLSEIGTYDIEYVITIDKNALEEIRDNDTTVSDDTDTEIEDTGINSETGDTEIENADIVSDTEDNETENVDIESEDTNTDSEIENADTEDIETENIKTEDIEDTASDDTETPDEDLEDIIINKTVDVVDEATADELVKDGEVVWTDDNEIYGDTEENVAKDDTKEESKTDEKTEDKDTEVAVNDSDTAKDNNDNTSSGTSENKSSNDSSSSIDSDKSSNNSSASSSNSNSSSSKSSSSSSSKSSSSSSSSGSSSSGNSSSSSGNTQTHTHNYVGTVTKSATCTSNGTKTYTCSCGASYTESIPATGHNWVEEYHEATGHYETVTVQAAYDEKVKVGSQYICNRCGAELGTDMDNVISHCKKEGSGYYTAYIYDTVHHDAVTEQQWVQDSAAYTSYKCSNCGATK